MSEYTIKERERVVNIFYEINAKLEDVIYLFELVESGDCGNWDVEGEDAAIAARKALEPR